MCMYENFEQTQFGRRPEPEVEEIFPAIFNTDFSQYDRWRKIVNFLFFIYFSLLLLDICLLQLNSKL